MKHLDLTQVQFSAKLQQTAQANSKCYASVLNNCDGSISKEHYLSADILKNFEYLETASIPFLKGARSPRIDPMSLCAKVLCEAHNSYLSPLDAFAGKLFKFLLSFYTDNRKTMSINGHALEKWMSKLLMGYLATKKVEHNGKTYSKEDIPRELIDYVYLDTPLPEEWGLYVYFRPGDQVNIGKRVGFSPIFLGNKIGGINLELSGIRLMLSLDKKNVAFKEDHPGFDHIMHRIRKIEIPMPGYLKMLNIVWE